MRSFTDDSGEDWTAHVFTADGTFNLSETAEVDYLLVGGGGGGSTAGGGAGGVVQGTITLAPGDYPVTVGAGGAGIRGDADPRPVPASPGGDSTFAGITALGGGPGSGTRGGADVTGDETDGGSGGGGGSSAQPGEYVSVKGSALQPGSPDGGLGHDGGDVTNFNSPFYAGGGGGAGGPAPDAGYDWAPGGPGITTTIDGTERQIAGGGAGGRWDNGTGLAGTHGGGSGGSGNARDGAPNTGGGGGGGARTIPGGTGGSGLVVIRYRSGPGQTAWVPESKPVWFTEIGCPAVDKGTNQPNKFLDPKSSESALPYFSDGRRDEAIQAQYIRALTDYWSDPENNPVSGVYGGRMVDMDRCFVWAWDARPFPWFPAERETWADGDNYARGHWISGRASGRSLSSVVGEICEAAGLSACDTARLHGHVRGYLVSEPGTARAALQPLMLAHGFDAVERDGALRFLPRAGARAAPVVSAALAESDRLEGTLERGRAAEAEQSGRVRLRFTLAEGDFQAAAEEAILPGEPGRSARETELPLALTRGEARQVAERWLAEAQVARDTARFALPPSAWALGAGDVVQIDGGARFRIDRVEQGEARLVEAVRVDPSVYRPARVEERPARLAPFVPPVPVTPLFLDLPLMRGDEAPHAPHLAVTATPWPGRVALYEAAEDEGYALSALIEARAAIGVTESPLAAATSGRIDRGPALRVRMISGALAATDDAGLLAGKNLIAVGDGSAGGWELLQFRDAQLVAPRSWLISHRLRGQAGSDGIMPAQWPAGSWVVVMDGVPRQIALSPALRDVARHWRIGPAGRPYDDPSYQHRVLAFAGEGLRPYRPCHLRLAEADGGLHARWIRRTRIDGDGWEAPEVPLGEEAERYLVRVTASGAVLREAQTEAPEWIYPADQRAADAGAGPRRIEVAQISARYGPGPFAVAAVPD
ncbi:hypothetical protein DRV85_01800 [Rhodosalinus halophilus]|uniref:Phage tail protein n=1 Tax=Rhodosalinus halophilus TaxID=2259333 RepID=A0A365UDY4_9RHOB|nr:hypothetical protein DRV85_01800 [Rhodosalinus halophilus]